MINKLRNSLLLLLLGIFLSLSAFALTLDDKGQINATSVARVVPIHTESDIIQTLQQAQKEHLSVSIMAKQHSEGGQTLAKNAVVLNMLPYHKVLNLNLKQKRITVQSGITWDVLQKIINPYNLAVIAMQSSNVFSVGGSMSVNCHGEDIHTNPISRSIISFHLILANGQKILVSPHENLALWNSVIGGYGLLGVISDVTLQLTDNNLLTGRYQETTIENLSHTFQTSVLTNKNAVLFFGRLNIVPGPGFLRDAYTITYTDPKPPVTPVIALDNPEKWDRILRPLFNWSRQSLTGKKIRWFIEKWFVKKNYANQLITRNNIMQEPIHFAIDYKSKHDADWLQEYYIPVDQLSRFVDIFRSVAKRNHINLLNVVIRYVPADPDTILSYAKTNSFGIVIYFNQLLSSDEIEKTRAWTQTLIDAAISLSGSYYLTYQNFATASQFQRAYPGVIMMIALKQHYDPQKLFISKFYQTYFSTLQ